VAGTRRSGSDHPAAVTDIFDNESQLGRRASKSAAEAAFGPALDWSKDLLSELVMPILIVGMDVLRHFRVYFAMGKLNVSDSPQLTLPALESLHARMVWQTPDGR